MVWKLNDPFEISISNILTDIPPVFDGKNVWVATSAGVSCIEYWGPYDDEDVYPNSSNIRWADLETDILSSKNIPQKLRVIKTVAKTGIQAMVYSNNRIIYATDSVIGGINPATGTLTAQAAVNVTRSSNIAVHNEKIFFIEALPTTQTLEDKQNLWYFNRYTGAVVHLGQLPSVKQSASRDLVVANEILYITCMNTRQVHKYNANTGAYLTSVVINRDPEKLYRVDNDVLIISSMRGKSIINAVEYATSMVSQLTQTDLVNHLYGILTAGKYMADEGDYAWFVNDSGLLQRTKKSDNKTFLSHGTGPILKTKHADYCIDNVADGVLNDAPASLSVSGIKNILITPQISYQHWDGITFQDVTVSKYMFLIKQNSVMMVKVPGALKWINNLTINQYTAMSTGGLGYKQG